jgi:hypothetical protein
MNLFLAIKVTRLPNGVFGYILRNSFVAPALARCTLGRMFNGIGCSMKDSQPVSHCFKGIDKILHCSANICEYIWLLFYALGLYLNPYNSVITIVAN